MKWANFGSQMRFNLNFCSQEDDDDATSSRAKAACKKMLYGRCVGKKGAFKCRQNPAWLVKGGRQFCGRNRVCCYCK